MPWIVIVVLAPVAMHLGIIGDRIRWVALWWPAVALVMVTALLVRQVRPPLLVALAAGVAFLIWAYRTASPHAVMAPSVAINLGLAWYFGRSLRRGREPLVTRIARIERSSAEIDFPAELVGYTRHVTQLWTAFFAFDSLILLVLAWVASLKAWSIYANLLNLPAVATLLLAEYLYRRRRFPHHSHLGPWRVALDMVAKPRAYFGS